MDNINKLIDKVKFMGSTINNYCFTNEDLKWAVDSLNINPLKAINAVLKEGYKISKDILDEYRVYTIDLNKRFVKEQITPEEIAEFLATSNREPNVKDKILEKYLEDERDFKVETFKEILKIIKDVFAQKFEKLKLFDSAIKDGKLVFKIKGVEDTKQFRTEEIVMELKDGKFLFVVDKHKLAGYKYNVGKLILAELIILEDDINKQLAEAVVAFKNKQAEVLKNIEEELSVYLSNLSLLQLKIIKRLLARKYKI